MNRNTIFATMGFTGLVIVMTILITSSNEFSRYWAIILGTVSLVMITMAYYLSGRYDQQERNKLLNELITNRAILDELKQVNINIVDLISEMREERNERTNKNKRKPKM
ncbi:hypothetical protein ACFLWU_00685 [Chloroflexota bacterium]